MRKELEQELDDGSNLAIALVDHLTRMGEAEACLLPVVDRAKEYVVIVMPKSVYDVRGWPVDNLRKEGKGE